MTTGKISLLLAAATFALATALPATAQNAARAATKIEIETFISRLSEAHGFDETEIRSIFSELEPHEGIIKAFNAPSTSKPWHEFRGIFLTPTRIEGGVAFWREHADLLVRAKEVYGVPEEIIVSIIGVETIYGRRLGSNRVIDALYTLGFEVPRRAKFFRGELEQFFLLARENGLDVKEVKGSFAGAMGMPQFIPSSYRNYAVDFSGDGKVDLWNDVADVIGSVANYLYRFGWSKAEPVTVPARLNGSESAAVLELGLKPQMTLAEMREKGVEAAEELPGNMKAGLFALENADGDEHWISLNNFYVITRYNRSKNYAMAVHQLAQEIARARGDQSAGQSASSQ
ncbi:MAG: lytic murein transglycosylase B [Burkholderiales bacterium]